MNKKIILLFSLFIVFISGVVIAGGYWDWDVKQIYTLKAYKILPPTTPGNNYSLEIGQTSRTTVLNGNVTNSATVTGGTYASPTITSPTISGTITGTGVVSDTNIADVTRSFSLPLAGAAIDGGDDIDDGSAPDITTLDNIPAILWDDSSETAAVQWTFRLPSDFVSDLVVYALVSSNDASGSGTKLDWAAAVNTDDTGFASPTAQDVVECTSATLDASNEVLTLTADATLEALLSAGTWISLEVFNASTNDDDLELKGLDVTYAAKQ
jgi:hypothetical protein